MLKYSKKYKLYQILLGISDAVDLISPELNSHHHKVAYLSYRIASELGLSVQECRTVMTQGLVHDIGALSVDERLSLLEEEPITVNSHAFRGAKLLSKCSTFAGMAEAIRYHHLPWDYGRGREFGGNPVPLNSHILHLADRVSVYIGSPINVISRSSKMIDYFYKSANSLYSPMLIEVLAELAKKEYIWLEMTDKSPMNFLPQEVVDLGELSLDEVLELAKVISHVIDFRSRFTATHSVGVARAAEKLAELSGMSGEECKMMLIAGYFHDLGKLVIKNSILEKPGKLTASEYNVIREHTFYTYKLLSGIDGFATINQWASFHHEKLNGKGYPFHLTADQIPLGSRIMTVADIFTAVTEHRPYRSGVDREQVKSIFRVLVEAGEVCGVVVDTLINNIDLFVDLCHKSQQEAVADYESFFEDDKLNANAV